MGAGHAGSSGVEEHAGNKTPAPNQQPTALQNANGGEAKTYVISRNRNGDARFLFVTSTLSMSHCDGR